MFQTVFGDDKNEVVVEAISNLLWENNRELYAVEEYDTDGLLIYQPPPLDEVWLSEPERRERKKRFREQQRRHDCHKRLLLIRFLLN